MGLAIFGCDISEQSVEILVPKEGGVGLSFLGLTGCSHIRELFLNSIASNFVFSKLVCTDTFVGFQPLESEADLRNDARIAYQRRLASTSIQSWSRALLIRMGVYRKKKNERSGE